MARETGRPVITAFDLYLLARRLFRDRGYKDEHLAPRNRELGARRARKLLADATFDPAWSFSDQTPPDRLGRDPEFRSILFVTGDGTAEQVLMAADPFCYLSHGSALAFHGLAEEGPALHLTTAGSTLWRARAIEYMSAALDFDIRGEDVDEDDLPFQLTNPLPHEEVRGKTVYRHETLHPLQPVEIQGDDIRVTPIGATFRDALDTPAWSGGITSVLALWRRHAPAHLEAIIAAIDLSREKILRVRAGYLLEEVLGLSDPRIASWVGDAQRGSSRKLDAAAPYASRFSARWMLSVNIDDPSLPSTTKG